VAVAEGGPVSGKGSGTSDDVPALLSNGEHIWTAAEVVGAGGHAAVKRLRDFALSAKFSLADAARYLNEADGARRHAVSGALTGLAGGGPADMSYLYAGLDNARPVSLPSLGGVSATPMTVNSSHHAGVRLENVTINNPVQEPAGDSLYRSVRKLAFEYEK
jgi:hypothetical protein